VAPQGLQRSVVAGFGGCNRAAESCGNLAEVESLEVAVTQQVDICGGQALQQTQQVFVGSGGRYAAGIDRFSHQAGQFALAAPAGDFLQQFEGGKAKRPARQPGAAVKARQLAPECQQDILGHVFQGSGVERGAHAQVASPHQGRQAGEPVRQQRAGLVVASQSRAYEDQVRRPFGGGGLLGFFGLQRRQYRRLRGGRCVCRAEGARVTPEGTFGVRRQRHGLLTPPEMPCWLQENPIPWSLPPGTQRRPALQQPCCHPHVLVADPGCGNRPETGNAAPDPVHLGPLVAFAAAETRPMPAKRPAKPAKSSPAQPKARAAAPAAGQDRLTQLEHLIELMVQKDVVEVELEDAGTRWRVRRKEPQAVTFAAPTAMAMPSLPTVVPTTGGGAAPAAAEAQGEVFKSPMLGTYYRAASPDAEPFAKVGDRVTADRTLCIIEAMKVMNEIKAEREFEILDILVKNGEPVEFGQPLFLIR